MLWIVLTMVVASAVGAAFAHRRPAAADDVAVRLMDLVLWCLIPIIVFFNLVHFELTVRTGAALGFAWLGCVIVVSLAYGVGRLLKLDRPQTGTLMICALLGNTAYLGYPFTVAALGIEHLTTAVSYDILVSIPALLLLGFSIGAAFGTIAESPRERIKVFFTKNPLLYAAALAMVAPGALAPDWAVDLSRVIVVAILPLGFFAVGIVVMREADEDKIAFPPPLTRAVAAAAAMRLTVIPAFLLGVSAAVIEIPDAYVLEAAMACGINNLLLANNYGLDRKLAAGAIVWSTMVVAATGLAIEIF